MASIAAFQQAPPVNRRSQSAPIFNYKLSTEENFMCREDIDTTTTATFYGPYSHIRQALDYNHHSHYIKERQWLQDAIMADVLKSISSSSLDTDELRINKDVNNESICKTPTEPWLIFVVSAATSKERPSCSSYNAICKLRNAGKFPLLPFVSVNADELREKLPEYVLYVDQYGPQKAHEMTRKEVTYLGELTIMTALQAGRNVVVMMEEEDPSLSSIMFRVESDSSDEDSFSEYIQNLKTDFPALRIAVIHISSSSTSLPLCSSTRDNDSKQTTDIKEIVEKARPLLDYVVELQTNTTATPNGCQDDDDKDIQLLTTGETWEHFTNHWLQTCAYVPIGTRRKKPSNKNGVREIM